MLDDSEIAAFVAWTRRCVALGRVRIEPKAEEEAAACAWDGADIMLFLADLHRRDFLRREWSRDPRFRWIWVFTPEIIEPEGRLWIRLADADGVVVVVISFHPENFNPEDIP